MEVDQNGEELKWKMTFINKEMDATYLRLVEFFHNQSRNFVLKIKFPLAEPYALSKPDYKSNRMPLMTLYL